MRDRTELAVPHVAQLYNYDCGAAAVCACLRFLGVDADLKDLIRRTRCAEPDSTGEPGGAAPEWLRKAAMDFSVVPTIAERMTIRGLGRLVAAGHPVILMAQCWFRGPLPTDMANTWSDGHYLVATAVLRGAVVFMDPAIDSGRGVMRPRDLTARWHDFDMLGGGPARQLQHTGIIFPAGGEAGRFQTIGKTRAIL
jgi:Peptidase_C39 like family